MSKRRKQPKPRPARPEGRSGEGRASGPPAPTPRTPGRRSVRPSLDGGAARGGGLDLDLYEQLVAEDAARSDLERAVAVVEGGDPLAALQAVALVRQELEVAEARAWAACRAAGLSWRELGDLLGVTRSAAQQRAASLFGRTRWAGRV